MRFSHRPIPVLLVLVLALSLLSACGSSGEIRSTPVPYVPGAPGASAAPAASDAPAPAQTPAPTEDVPETQALRLEDLAGLWELYSFEVEGAAGLASEEGAGAWLRLRADGWADYLEEAEFGQWPYFTGIPMTETDRGTVTFDFFDYAVLNATRSFELYALEGELLSVSCTWENPDGTPGSSESVYRLVEADGPDFRGRHLTARELDLLSWDLNDQENGFFTCTYDRPEEIDWSEVCYCGAVLSVELTEEQRAEFERYNGEIFLALEAIPEDELGLWAVERTGVPYSEARKPLGYPDWTPVSDGEGGVIWCFQHGDTNYQEIHFTDGWQDGNYYELYYTRDDWENWIPERSFVIRANIVNGFWQYISNLPADAPAPLPLLDIAYVETREEAQRLGVTEFIDLEPRESDEPYGWVWAVVTAETDGVRYILDRVSEEVDYDLYGVPVPGDNIASGVLREGERFAVYTNQPWHPALLLTATKDAFWGQYSFGEDNWLHLDDTAHRYITGHDLQGEGRGCEPETLEQTARFLMDGSWVCYDEAGAPAAVVDFYGNYALTVSSDLGYYDLYLDYLNLDAAPDDAPDAISLEWGFYEFSDWDTLPTQYTRNDLGTYRISAIQLDGEQLLYLAPTGGSESALGCMIPGAASADGVIELHRYRGTVVSEGQG